MTQIEGYEDTFLTFVFLILQGRSSKAERVVCATKHKRSGAEGDAGVQAKDGSILNIKNREIIGRKSRIKYLTSCLNVTKALLFIIIKFYFTQLCI